MKRKIFGMILSRIAITGRVHAGTPLCVLLEIADAHGIDYQSLDPNHSEFSTQLLESIHQISPPSLESNSWSSMEWGYVARFVNCKVQWTSGTLLTAYNFLMDSSQLTVEHLPSEWISGAQTPEHPTSLNACMIYKICMELNLQVGPTTTLDQMTYAVRVATLSLPEITRHVMMFVQRASFRELINCLLLSPQSNIDLPEISPPSENPIEAPSIQEAPLNSPENYNLLPSQTASHEMLIQIHHSLHDVNRLQHMIEPTTENGAIALAAINYNLDLSFSSDPLLEYRTFRRDGRDYLPVDPWMRHWYQQSRDLFDLQQYFNPLFPECFYSAPILRNLALQAGFTETELSVGSAYELLQLAHVTETFYLGIRPGLKSTVTPIDLDSISEISPAELLSYGQLAEGATPLQPVTISELIQLFTNNQNFTNPFHPNSVFSSLAISKLKLLLASPRGAESMDSRNELLEIIRMIEASTRNLDQPTKQLIAVYRNASPDTKSEIIRALNQLVHAGMYMRGWQGPGYEYPVTSAPTPLDREAEVAVNVTQTLAAYESSCRSLGRIGIALNALPLVLCRDGQYQVSTSVRDGLTIGDRITIVKGGDSSANIGSCIRLSSNWICSSAHKYITSLGQRSPFDIFHLRYVS